MVKLPFMINSLLRPNGRVQQNIFLRRQLSANSGCQLVLGENSVLSFPGNFRMIEFFNKIRLYGRDVRLR